ncbi:J domain-containing protein [Aggregatilinea lenta]|uniref:J domain-containing protein n=1 Tax=Aggregatilinea lenta TaxID=913108 RepID=UPI000E5C4D32|nr:J domain-containing protein [Aggregatilinea lenta]
MRRKIIYDPARDYYVVLGVSPAASTEEIRRAFRRRALEVHPDRHPDRRDQATRQFQLLNEAYGVLKQSASRREYDRLRWPHAPHRVRPAASFWGSGPDSTDTIDPDHPWWQRATAQSARQAAHLSSAPVAPVAPGWMRRYGLEQYESTWSTLVGLWRTPYAGLLLVLSALLALNLAIVVYMAIAPGESHAFIDQVEGWFAEESTATPAPTAESSLFRTCTNSGVQILNLVSFDKVGETFALYGTARHADLWSYVIELGYLGRTYDPQAIPRSWTIVRPSPANQSVPEAPIDHDVLASIDLSGYARGYYVLRLRLILRSGAAQTPCDVIIQH